MSAHPLGEKLHLAARATRPPGGAAREVAPLVVGLVNNMPDGALEATERQLTQLLLLSATDCAVTLRTFSIFSLPRSAAGRRHVAQHHENIDALWLAALDGLIVTGMEPRHADFEDEPYWPIFARLIDLTEDRGLPTLWSCLAAHAAAYRLDGVRRTPRSEKLTGVFDSTLRGRHPLTDGLPARWCVPHSRRYELPVPALLTRGYRILSGAEEIGADMFVRRGRSLGLFLQGHPEYELESLGREYRRDVKRYLQRQADHYPSLPQHYFTGRAEAALEAFRNDATRRRDAALISSFPDMVPLYTPPPPWHGIARQLYRNWLRLLVRRRDQRRGGDRRSGYAAGTAGDARSALSA